MKDYRSTFDRAWALAEIAHHGQTYGDKPYTYHLEQVFERVHQGNPGHPGLEQALIVAVLHDIVEDTPVTMTDVRTLVTGDPTVLGALILLTRNPGQHYVDYIDQVMTDHTARIVKIADLKTNLANKPNKSLRERYEWALEMLEGPGHE